MNFAIFNESIDLLVYTTFFICLPVANAVILNGNNINCTLHTFQGLVEWLTLPFDDFNLLIFEECFSLTVEVEHVVNISYQTATTTMLMINVQLFGSRSGAALGHSTSKSNSSASSFFNLCLLLANLLFLLSSLILTWTVLGATPIRVIKVP